MRCYTCGKSGHVKKDCQQDPDKSSSAARDTERYEMFQFPAKGHLAASCPHGAMFCSERRVDYKQFDKNLLHVHKDYVCLGKLREPLLSQLY